MLSLLIILTLLIYISIKYKMTYFQRFNVHVHEPSLILGNLNGVGSKIHIAERIQEIYESAKENYKFCGFYLLQSPLLILIDLNLIQNIFVKNFQNFIDRGVFFSDHDTLSNHLFALEGERWKGIRSKMGAAMSSGRMRLMFSMIQNQLKTFVDILDESSESDQGIDIKNICTRFTIDSIGSCGFGIECNALRNEQSEIMKLTKFFDIKTSKEKINYFVANAFVNFARKFKFSITPKEISDFFIPMIREIFEFRMKNGRKFNDFLSHLIENETLSFDEIAAQAFIFFIGGFDTSSTAMTMALYELAHDAEVQKKLRKEIIEFTKDQEISYETLNQMQYLDQVVKETLRLHPPFGLAVRKALNDYEISSANYTIKKGQRVLIPIHAIHRDSKIYADPEKFDPNRFEPEELRKRHKLAYIPFGDGPRVCIGKRFAYMQIKLAIATIIKKFDINLHENTDYPLTMDSKSLTLVPLKSIKLNMRKL